MANDGLLRSVTPHEAVAREAFGDLDVPPSDAEWAHVRTAVPPRRAEFGTVRALARDAMTALDHRPVEILPDERGVPGWPPGLIGSMTHCTGYRAAAVAVRGDLRRLGIDAEPNRVLPPGVRKMVVLPAENSQLTALAAGHPSVAWDRLLFSAKEAVFKAWFPDTRIELDFTDVQIAFDGADHFSFAVRDPRGTTRSVSSPPVWTGVGHARIEGDLLVTAVWERSPPRRAET